jgi:hypothetical protein
MIFAKRLNGVYEFQGPTRYLNGTSLSTLARRYGTLYSCSWVTWQAIAWWRQVGPEHQNGETPATHNEY